MLTAGFKNIFHAFSVPLNSFFILLLTPLFSEEYCFGVNGICFRPLYLVFGNESCSFRIVPLLLKSHHAESNTELQCQARHYPILSRFEL